MGDDLVERLRETAQQRLRAGDGIGCALPLQAAAEIERLHEKLDAAEKQLAAWRKDPTPSMKMREENRALREWKADAMKVLAGWDAVAEMFTYKPKDLGRSKSSIVATEIERLREEFEQFRTDAREVLGVYGDHKRTCVLRNTPASESLCTCGWRKVILGPGWKVPRALDADGEEKR